MFARLRVLFIFCFWAIVLALFSTPLEHAAAQQMDRPGDLIGVLIALQADGLEIRAITVTDGILELTHWETLASFTIENHTAADWNIWGREAIALSPDQRYLAFAAGRLVDGLSLFIFDVSAQTLAKQPLDLPHDKFVNLIWSPDSEKVIVSTSVSLPGNTQVYDTRTRTLRQVITSQNLNIRWLADSDRFLYFGSAVCPQIICRVFWDVYLGDRLGLNGRPLTSFDVRALGLAEQMQVPYLIPFIFTWSEDAQRAYIVVGEQEAQGGIRRLYSVDLEGNLRLEADLAAYFEGSLWPPSVWPMFTRDGEEGLWLVTQTQDYSLQNAYSWSLLRMGKSGQLDTIFEKTYLWGQDVYTIAAQALSEDAGQLALAGASPSADLIGNLVIVDTQSGLVVLDTLTPEPACTLVLTDEGLLYTQAALYRSTCSVRNRRFRQLVWYDFNSGEHRAIDAPESQVFYLIPSRGPGF